MISNKSIEVRGVRDFELNIVLEAEAIQEMSGAW